MDPLPERGMDGVAAPNCAEPLARRRRHAWLLATLTELIGDCAQAAGEVYRPVAEAPPTQTDVPVNLGLLGGLCRYSGDAARAQDAARCAITEAEGILAQADGALADVGADFLTDLLDDPAQAVKWVQERASTGEFTVDQILGEATDSVGCPDCSTKHSGSPTRAQRRRSAWLLPGTSSPWSWSTYRPPRPETVKSSAGKADVHEIYPVRCAFVRTIAQPRRERRGRSRSGRRNRCRRRGRRSPRASGARAVADQTHVVVERLFEVGDGDAVPVVQRRDVGVLLISPRRGDSLRREGGGATEGVVYDDNSFDTEEVLGDRDRAKSIRSAPTPTIRGTPSLWSPSSYKSRRGEVRRGRPRRRSDRPPPAQPRPPEGRSSA